jgi:hypothetical protein
MNFLDGFTFKFVGSMTRHRPSCGHHLLNDELRQLPSVDSLYRSFEVRLASLQLSCVFAACAIRVRCLANGLACSAENRKLHAQRSRSTAEVVNEPSNVQTLQCGLPIRTRNFLSLRRNAFAFSIALVSTKVPGNSLLLNALVVTSSDRGFHCLEKCEDCAASRLV